MPTQISLWCQRILNTWYSATLVDYAFAVAWVVIVGYLISKLTSYPTR